MKPTRAVAVVVVCAMVCLSGSAAAPAPAQATLPDTPAGKLVADLVAALNASDPAVLERFVAEHWSPNAPRRMTAAERAAGLRRLHDDAGELTLDRVESVTPGEIDVRLTSRKSPPVRLGVMLEEGAAPRILGLRVQMGGPDEGAPAPAPVPPVATVDEAVKAIADAAAAATAADEFAGVVLVARDGTPLLRAAYGLADRGLGVANRPDTKFNLGSINKIFTRTAIAQLAAAGALSLDDRLGKWLPDYPNAAAREQVTLRQIVEMTSGIGDFFGEKFAATPKDRFRANRDFLPMFAADELQFAPGSQRRYSNGGYVVLGEVIAAASHSDYYEYVRAHIFAKALMVDTDSFMADAIVPNLAQGYTRGGDGGGNAPLRANIYTRPARGSAAGGGYSTADDLLRFAGALQRDELAPPAWTAWVLGGPEPTAESTPPSGPHDEGGLGIAGGAPGINAALEIDPATGFVIVVLANLDPPAAGRIAQHARRILAALPPAK